MRREPDVPVGSYSSADRQGDTDYSASMSTRPPDPLIRVAVVIVSYDSADVIEGCLGGLARSRHGVDLVSVVLADNDSSDATIDRATACWPGLRVVRTGGNLGYAAGVNQGQRASRAHDCILVLNPDTILRPEAVLHMARAVHEGPAGMAVPRMTDLAGRLSHNLRRWPSVSTAAAEAALGGRLAARLGLGEVVVGPGKYEHVGPVDWATGAAVMIGRSCWLTLGDWDESFFLYSEETEYMLRARGAGLQVVFVPDAVCAHRGGESGTSPRLWSLLLINKVRLFRRSHGRLESAAFQGLLLAGQSLRALLGSRTARAATRSLSRRLNEQFGSAAPPIS